MTKFNFSIQTFAKSITIIFIISSSKSDSSNWNNFSNFYATNVRRPGTAGLSSPMSADQLTAEWLAALNGNLIVVKNQTITFNLISV